MTINPPASILLAMYSAVAEKQGAGKEQIGGTIGALFPSPKMGRGIG
jgi:methylmalonyl-CoA mutase N-terminal domain/subunit